MREHKIILTHRKLYFGGSLIIFLAADSSSICPNDVVCLLTVIKFENFYKTAC